MKYSLITEDENGCQIIVRSANSLENLIRNIVTDNVRILKGADGEMNYDYVELFEISNSFEAESIYHDGDRVIFSYERNKYKIMFGESTIPVVKTINLWDKISEEIKNTRLYNEKSIDYHSYRNSPADSAFNFKRNSPQHCGRIRVMSELKKNKGYEDYRKENRDLNLPKSRKLPESWGVNGCQRYNVRGERDWKRNRCRKQWMKHKCSGEYMRSVEELSETVRAQNENLADTMHELYFGHSPFYYSEKKENLDEFYETYADDIEEELSNNGNNYGDYDDYNEYNEYKYNFKLTVKCDICGKEHMYTFNANNRLIICSSMCDSINRQYGGYDAYLYDLIYDMDYGEEKLYEYHIFKIEQKFNCNKAA